MNNNKCIVCRIYPSAHPTDVKLRMSMLVLWDGDTYTYRHVVTGDHYTQGQLGFFIPENAIVPDKLADEMWVKGKLAGKQGNRVKARMFKGILTEGLFYGSQGASWNPAWKVGDDVTHEVGITFTAL